MGLKGHVAPIKHQLITNWYLKRFNQKSLNGSMRTSLAHYKNTFIRVFVCECVYVWWRDETTARPTRSWAPPRRNCEPRVCLDGWSHNASRWRDHPPSDCVRNHGLSVFLYTIYGCMMHWGKTLCWCVVLFERSSILAS